MYVGMPNTATYNLRKVREARRKIRGFKLKRAVHRSLIYED